MDAREAEKLRKLRTTIEVQAEMCLQLVDALLGESGEEEDVEDGALACVFCGDPNVERTDDMRDIKRFTCLECGKSWYPNGESEGVIAHG